MSRVNNTKVSIIIPVYNVEKYIERCARSLFEQTLEDVEYIFIDDCSQDRSIEILEEVLKDYPNRIFQTKIIHLLENCGQAKVREKGIQLASGEYIIQCDSDDWVPTNAYSRMLEIMNREKYDMLFCDFYRDSNGKSEYVSNLIEDKGDTIRRFLLNKSRASFWLTMIRRELFSSPFFIYPQYDMTEDFTAIVQLVYLSDRIGYLHEAMYHYCVNNLSLSWNLSESICLKRYYDMRGNMDILISFFSRNSDCSFDKELKIRFFENKEQLYRLIIQPKYYFMWLTDRKGCSYFHYLFSELVGMRKKKRVLKNVAKFPLMIFKMLRAQVHKQLKIRRVL